MTTRTRQAGTRHQAKEPSDRLRLITVGVSLFALLIVVRVFYLQVIKHDVYAAMAKAQHALQTDIEPLRGTILASSLDEPNKTVPLATTRTFGLLYAVPIEIQDASNVAESIRQVLPDLDQNEVVAKLSKPEDQYEELAHKLTDEQRQAINDKKIKGIYIADERVRYYPNKNIGAHVLGFLGMVGDLHKGQYGLEGENDTLLAGTKGFLNADRDAGGRWIVTGLREFQQAKDGSSLVLTIDDTIQYTACTKLNEAVAKHGADSGSVVIMNPRTGAILAMCGSPDYDPNEYNKVEDIKVYTNEATAGAYEPGSVFKPLTMAASLNEGKISPQTTYTDAGVVTIGSYNIKNSDGKANGVQTMTEVLEKSLNTGAIFAMRQIGPDTFRNYVKNFGFGAKEEIGVQGEVVGDISNLNKSGEIYSLTASFGQGITVTPLQLTSAYGAIANNGKLMRPFIIQKVIDPSGSEKVTEAQEVRQVIRPEVATTLGAMLVNVVENGHGKKAGVPGYYIAGKTGTAQVKYANGPGYDPNNTIGTFAGFGPVSDPVFVMVVRIDHPRDVTFAESTAAPLFGDLAKFLLHYLHVAPDRVE